MTAMELTRSPAKTTLFAGVSTEHIGWLLKMAIGHF
jgi:hypothetical protein